MSSRVALLVVATGCGRLEFESLGRGDAAASVDDDAGLCAPANGLIGAWSLDSTDVVGATAIDRSGNGRDGTIMGTPKATAAPGRIGTALDFAGTSLSWVDVATIPFNTTPGGFNSVSLWFRNDDPVADEGMFCLPAGPLAGPPRNCLWLTDDGGSMSLCINGGDGDCWGITDPGLIGRWVHVVGIFANGPTVDGAFYIDGAPATMACEFGVCNESRVAQPPFEIGTSDSVYAWHGMLDEVRVFDRALTPSEIEKLYMCAP